MKLTKLEKQLIEYGIAQTDESNSFLLGDERGIYSSSLRELGWSKNRLKGVYGSLVKKKILNDETLEGDPFKLFYWTCNVNNDRPKNELINTLSKMEAYFERNKNFYDSDMSYDEWVNQEWCKNNNITWQEAIKGESK